MFFFYLLPLRIYLLAGNGLQEKRYFLYSNCQQGAEARKA